MPATTVTCPSCNTTLKPKTPVPGGTRLKCPKCTTIFVVQADDAADVSPTAAAPPKPAGPKLGAPMSSTTPKPAAPRPAAPKPPPAEEDIPEVTEVIDDADGDEGSAPAKPKKKAIPLWVWLVGGGVGLFVLCGCCGGPIGYFAAYGIPGFGGSSAVTEANYKQVKKGMTEADVQKIMGGAPSLTLALGDMKSDTWKGSGDDFITVQFGKDGKALVGGFQFTNGAVKLSGGGPLP